MKKNKKIFLLFLPLIFYILIKLLNKMTKRMIVPNLSYNEVIYSKTAIDNNIDNTPNSEQLANIQLLAENIFTPLRNHFNNPIKITSFFRNYELNKLVGGSSSSQHREGKAMDIKGTRNTNKEIFDYIKDNLQFDQLIFEYGTDSEPQWVHVSFNQFNNRNQLLRAKRINGKTVYLNYV